MEKVNVTQQDIDEYERLRAYKLESESDVERQWKSEKQYRHSMGKLDDEVGNIINFPPKCMDTPNNICEDFFCSHSSKWITDPHDNEYRIPIKNNRIYPYKTCDNFEYRYNGLTCSIRKGCLNCQHAELGHPMSPEHCKRMDTGEQCYLDAMLETGVSSDSLLELHLNGEELPKCPLTSSCQSCNM